MLSAVHVLGALGDRSLGTPHVGLALVDPQENAIIRAVVRAFAVPKGGTAFVEIGRTMTDGTGRYELFLAGTPHP